MKNTALKLLFLANHMLLILYMSWHMHGVQINIEDNIALLISSLMLTDITYISSCNIRESRVIWLFCGLLALDSWYLLLPPAEGVAEQMVFKALSPIIWYVSVRFILMFLFQGSGYKFRKTAHIIFGITCIGTLIGICISDRMFAGLYGIQFLSYCVCFLFLITYHWGRISFVLKSEWKCISFSAAVIMVLFLTYYFATRGMQDHISNFGIYLPVLLFFTSIHGIMLKEHSSYPLSTVFSKKQTVCIIGVSLILLVLIVLTAGGGYKEVFIAVNGGTAFIYICNIVLGVNLKQGRSRIIKESKYHAALRQLQQEEQLKTEFANFLHDDILQDLLSVKNMMTKAHRPEIQDLIIETLDNLNRHIREQMQDYHPVILKNLTVRENFQNLIETVSQSFPRQNIKVSLECPDSLFLVEPYQVFLYRTLKELLTNVYKHSDGSRAWVTLMQEKGMVELSVSDDGTVSAGSLHTADRTKHKGIASIAEQVSNMDGNMDISDHMPCGICIHITIPMKGDVSYQYFIS